MGRTVRSAREGIGADSDDPSFVARREAQLLIDYAGSPIIAGPEDATPFPGTRAPDARGLTRTAVTAPIRTAVEGSHGEMEAYLVAAPAADTRRTLVPVLRDADGQLVAAYHAADGQVFVLRPDGYLGYRGDAGDLEALQRYLKATFA